MGWHDFQLLASFFITTLTFLNDSSNHCYSFCFNNVAMDHVLCNGTPSRSAQDVITKLHIQKGISYSNSGNDDVSNDERV